jgi:hypothetical protein
MTFEIKNSAVFAYGISSFPSIGGTLFGFSFGSQHWHQRLLRSLKTDNGDINHDALDGDLVDF